MELDDPELQRPDEDKIKEVDLYNCICTISPTAMHSIVESL